MKTKVVSSTEAQRSLRASDHIERAERFPGVDPKQWNQGQWPPVRHWPRWRELYLAVLTGAVLHSGKGPIALTEDAEAIADWALRRELERSP